MTLFLVLVLYTCIINHPNLIVLRKTIVQEFPAGSVGQGPDVITAVARATSTAKNNNKYTYTHTHTLSPSFKILFLLCFVFVLFLASSQHTASPGWGSDPSYRCDLRQSCGNTRHFNPQLQAGGQTCTSSAT